MSIMLMGMFAAAVANVMMAGPHTWFWTCIACSVKSRNAVVFHGTALTSATSVLSFFITSMNKSTDYLDVVVAAKRTNYHNDVCYLNGAVFRKNEPKR